MKNAIKITRDIFLVLMTLVMVGCTVTPASTPTTAPAQAQPAQDLNPVKTSVAQTVVAQITSEAASNPTAAPIVQQPTSTPMPAVVLPTGTAIALVLPTSTTAPVVSGGSSGGGYSGGGSVAKTSTPTLTYVDSAVLVSQSPTDGGKIAAGTDFDATWTIKNTGRRVWNKDFYFIPDPDYESQLKVSSKPVYLSAEVGKRDTYKFVVDMTAPKTPGTYRTWWVLVNDDGVDFFHFFMYVTIK